MKMGPIGSDINLNYWETQGAQKTFCSPNTLLDLSLPKDATILDVGCGQGRTLLDLIEQGYTKLFGIDYSETMINLAKRNLDSRVKLFRGRASDLPFEDRQFDAVLLYSLLNCIPNPSEEKTIVKEAVRVLKPEGYLLINDFEMSGDRAYTLAIDEDGEYGTFLTDTLCTMRHTSSKRLRSMTVDLQEIQHRVYDSISMNGHPVRMISKISKTKATLDETGEP